MKRATVVLLTLLVSVLTWDASAAAGPAGSASSPAPSPTWLRAAAPAKATQTPAAPTSTGFSYGKIGALFLIVGLGGYALYVKRKRAAQNPLKGSGGLRVIESARLGPKAALVTAVVGRRVILLGVTEQSVSKLGWLSPSDESDEAEEDADADAEPALALDPGSEPPVVAPARPVLGREEPARAKVRPSDGSFSSRLRSALGTTAPATSDDALATSAQLTRDVVDVGRGRRRARTANPSAARSAADDAMIDVEAQAAGLIRRLKGKSQ